MSDAEQISLKLSQSAEKVDSYIEILMEPRMPIILYDAAGHIIRAGGKRLRPYLVLKACELVGGEVDAAVPFAAALELFHNFTLIHDDIIDNDELRRGNPTVHSKWGIPIAIVSGDLLFAKVYEAISKGAEFSKLPYERVQACIDRVTDAAINICEGQVLDISSPHVSNISEEDYLSMIGGKTAALFKACAEVGAIVGGGSPEMVNSLSGFAWNAGIAFQLVDDYLGITADEEILGKPVGSDIREGKKTLIIIHSLCNASPEEKKSIERVLGSDDAPQREIKAVFELLRELGSISYILEKGKYYARKATAMLKIFPYSEPKQDLLDLVEYFVNRVY
jgi:geranylgeranyl diphosphate synthase type I